MKICIVAHFALDTLLGRADGHLGGVERQVVLLARWLSGAGHDVSLVTWGDGTIPEEGVRIHGVRVIPVCRRDEGLAGIRFLHPRWSSLLKALRRSGADLYYQNCGECVTGQVARWCLANRKAFVFSSASDMDCDASLPGLPRLRERILYRYGLAKADRVIVQSERQAAMLLEGFSRESVILPIAGDDPFPGEGDTVSERADGPFDVLWLGRIHPVKRPGLLLDLAERLPRHRFLFAGPKDAPEEFVAPILERAARLPNVESIGAVPPGATTALYRRASVLLSTSRVEGFPNTFVEAWAHGVPVVTTFDPDGVVESRGAGIHRTDAEGIARALEGLAEDPATLARMSRSARLAYLSRYSPGQVFPRYEALFREILRGGGPG
jgi:glycosyltransferase involved in cell wall biosynthesis